MKHQNKLRIYPIFFSSLIHPQFVCCLFCCIYTQIIHSWSELDCIDLISDSDDDGEEDEEVVAEEEVVDGIDDNDMDDIMDNDVEQILRLILILMLRMKIMINN